MELIRFDETLRVRYITQEPRWIGHWNLIGTTNFFLAIILLWIYAPFFPQRIKHNPVYMIYQKNILVGFWRMSYYLELAGGWLVCFWIQSGNYLFYIHRCQLSQDADLNVLQVCVNKSVSECLGLFITFRVISLHLNFLPVEGCLSLLKTFLSPGKTRSVFKEDKRQRIVDTFFAI